MLSAPLQADRVGLKRCLQHHPEGLILLTAALLLERARPAETLKLGQFLGEMSALYQRAAELPSMLASGHPSGACDGSTDASGTPWRLDPPDLQARRLCVTNLEWTLSLTNMTPTERKFFFNLAYEIGDYELGREPLRRGTDPP